MTIQESDLKCYKAEANNDTAANGGRASTDAVTSGAAQNVFPHVFKAERAAGLVRYRKIIYRNENDDDESGLGAQPFFHHPPAGDHYLWYHIGTHIDTQADITGSERRYGSAFLALTASAGQKTLVVALKHADQAACFADGDTINVSAKSTPKSATGNEEQHVINGAPSLTGLNLTITTTNNLANSYAAAVCSVTSGPAGVELACSVPSFTDADNLYDDALLTLDNIGTVYDQFTLTYDGAGGFSVVGQREGNLPDGTTAANYAPPNSSKSNKPYFTLPATGHEGTESAGDQLVFITAPAAINVWETLTVPAGADPIGSGGLYSYLDVES